MNAFLDGWDVFINDWQLITGMLTCAVIFAVLLHSRFKTDLGPVSFTTGICLTLFFTSTLLLRLAYVSKAIFPSYFDSAQHYAIIKNILAGNPAHIFDAPPANYYHMGFHFVAAFFTSIFHVEITTTMLILGQVVLAVLPFPLFFIVRHTTRSDTAAGFVLILSAFGWYMPAHAVDWGKYPALMSLGMIPFVLSLASFLFRNDLESASLLANLQRRPVLYGLFGLSILLTVFTHSRSLIVFGIVFLAWMVSTWRKKLSIQLQSALFIFISSIIILLVIFIQKQDILSLLFDPYLEKGLLITILVLLLSIFALRAYHHLVFMCVFSICLLLVSLFIPVGGLIPGREFLTLLDRPFVEMILFLPLSLLGGLGVAGLEKKTWGRYVGLLAIGIVAVNAYFTYDLYPSDCCVIVGKDDVVAMDWAANQLPVKARIGIASTELKVINSESFEGIVGSDAGIWLMPLTDRNTVALPYDTEFDGPSALEQICELRISHLYVGGVGQPFDNTRLLSRPEWYKPLLSMPKARVYEVIGCKS